MRTRSVMLAAAAAVLTVGTYGEPISAQQAAGSAAAAAAPTGMRLELTDGSRALYRVREQFVGINFPSDAVGMTEAITGVLVIRPDGSVDSEQSRFSVDLRTLRSDQDQRDNFMRGPRGLDTERFPTAEFVPRQAIGMPWPFPSEPPAQAGFQLVGDMTVYGTTTDVTWNVVATFNPERVAGRAITGFTFETFGIPKPQIARLLSVDENIHLEFEFRLSRAPL